MEAQWSGKAWQILQSGGRKVRKGAVCHPWDQCAELRAQQLQRPCGGSMLACSQKNKVSAAGATWRREAGRMGPDPLEPSGCDVRAIVGF